MAGLAGSVRHGIMRRARAEGGVWTVLAVLAFGVRTLARLAAREPEVHREVLGPGQTITITHTTESRRDAEKRRRNETRDRKRQRAAAKKAARAARRTS